MLLLREIYSHNLCIAYVINVNIISVLHTSIGTEITHSPETLLYLHIHTMLTYSHSTITSSELSISEAAEHVPVCLLTFNTGFGS